MKKLTYTPKFLYALYGVAFVLLIAVVIVTGLNVKKNRTVQLISYDQQATIIIEGAAASRPKMIPQKLCNRFSPRNINIFKKCIRNNEAYMYSIEEDGSRSQNETGKYLLYKDHRYFVVERHDHTDSKGKSGTVYYCIQPMVDTCRLQEYVGHLVFLPVVVEDNKIVSDDPLFFKWSETLGISDFEELKEFYLRIEDDYYTVDEENKCIILNSASTLGTKSVARIYASDEGITFVRWNRES